MSGEERLTAGDLVVPFTRGDFRRLALLERSLAAKRQGGAAAAAATADAPLSEEEEQELAAKVSLLDGVVRSGEASEEDWREMISLDDAILYRGLLVIMALVPLPPDAFHALVQSFYIIATLDPARVYKLAVAHSAAVDKLLLSISPELDPLELGARFRLLDLLLVEAASHPDLALDLRATDFEEAQQEFLECLANQSQSVFALTVSNMLLLNSIDSKHTLHRVLMGKQAELASPSHAASAAASSPRSPHAAPLNTASLSRFSQELITLVNSGRLPPQWVDEGEITTQHSGTDRARSGSVEDLFTSSRAQVNAPPPRDPTCHPLTSAALAFLSQLFATDTALDLLYTNDIQVLVEVIVRRVEDEQENVAATLAQLLCLSAIVKWKEFSENPFKLNEIRALLTTVAANYPRPAALSEEQTAALSPQEAEEAENRIAVHELVQIMQAAVEKL